MPHQRNWAIGIIRDGDIVKVPERLRRVTLQEASTFVQAFSRDNTDEAAILHHPISAAILDASSRSRDS